MWDLRTLKRLNKERVEYLRAQKQKQEEPLYKDLIVEEVVVSSSKKERDYVYKYVPVEMQDKGAYDEGYYYNFCYGCNKKTEHDDESCCVCDTHNPD